MTEVIISLSIVVALFFVIVALVWRECRNRDHARCPACGIAFMALPGRSLINREVCSKCDCRRLYDLLMEAYDGLIWCSASEDFQKEGKARVGWLRGPANTMNHIEKYLKDCGELDRIKHGE